MKLLAAILCLIPILAYGKQSDASFSVSVTIVAACNVVSHDGKVAASCTKQAVAPAITYSAPIVTQSNPNGTKIVTITY